jgi:Vacuolar protein sorting-associated protein 62
MEQLRRWRSMSPSFFGQLPGHPCTTLPSGRQTDRLWQLSGHRQGWLCRSFTAQGRERGATWPWAAAPFFRLDRRPCSHVAPHAPFFRLDRRPCSYVAAGDCLAKGYDPPMETVVIQNSDALDRRTGPSGTRDDDTPLLKPPREYQLVWSDDSERRDRCLSIWRPLPYDGYVAMGHVANIGLRKPSRMVVRCIRYGGGGCGGGWTIRHRRTTNRPERAVQGVVGLRESWPGVRKGVGCGLVGGWRAARHALWLAGSGRGPLLGWIQSV